MTSARLQNIRSGQSTGLGAKKPAGEGNPHSRFGEEAEAEHKDDTVAAQLDPVDPMPARRHGDPVRDERAGRVRRKDDQDERGHRRSSRSFRPEVGDDAGGGWAFNAGGGALDEPAEDEGVDIRSQRLTQKEEHDTAGTGPSAFHEPERRMMVRDCRRREIVETHIRVQMTICGRRPNVSETGARTSGPMPSMARYVNDEAWKSSFETLGWSSRKPSLAAPFAWRHDHSRESARSLMKDLSGARSVHAPKH